MVGEERGGGNVNDGQHKEEITSEKDNDSIYFSVDKTRKLLEAGMKETRVSEVKGMIPELKQIVTSRYSWTEGDERLVALAEKIEVIGDDMEKGSQIINDFFVKEVGDEVHEEYLRRVFVESIKSKAEIVELNEILSCHKAEDGDVYLHLAPCRTMSYPDRMLKFVEGMNVLANSGLADVSKSIGLVSWIVSEVPEMHEMLGFEVSSDLVDVDLALNIDSSRPEEVKAAFMDVVLLKQMYGEVKVAEIMGNVVVEGSFLREKELVLSEGVGINLDHNLIPEPVYLKSLKDQRRILLSDSKIESVVSGMETVDVLKMRMDKVVDSLVRMKNLEEYMKDMKDPIIRVHPPGDMSPLSVDKAFVDGESGRVLKIDANFLRSMDRIVDKAEKCTVVVPFFDKRNSEGAAANIPNTTEGKDDYVSVVESMVARYGAKTRIQISNEVNVLWGAKKQFEHPQHVSDVDPVEYADFYFETVSRVKEKYPEARIGLAGLVCFDPEFLKTMLDRLKELGLGSEGIDAVDVHMYRKEALLGAEEIRDGVFVDDEKNPESVLSYEDQMRQYQKIIKESGFEVELIVGEFRFGVQGEQKKAIVDTDAVRLSKIIDGRVGVKESILYPLGQIA